MLAFIFSFLIRLYPLFWLNGILVGRWRNNYKHLRVYLVRQPLNINAAFSIFGGSIASAADPFLPLMYRLAMMKSGIKISVWTKSVHVRFVKPVNRLAYFDYVITAEELDTAVAQLKEKGKYVETHHVQCIDKSKVVYAIAEIQTYMKLVN